MEEQRTDTGCAAPPALSRSSTQQPILSVWLTDGPAARARRLQTHARRRASPCLRRAVLRTHRTARLLRLLCASASLVTSCAESCGTSMYHGN
eukprot:3745365-Pleurochrysis_carterae.AAC.1